MCEDIRNGSMPPDVMTTACITSFPVAQDMTAAETSSDGPDTTHKKQD